jgi:hypothetical protein
MFEVLRSYESRERIAMSAAKRQFEEVPVLWPIRQWREGIPPVRTWTGLVEYRVKLVSKLVVTDLAFALYNSEREPVQIML